VSPAPVVRSFAAALIALLTLIPAARAAIYTVGAAGTGCTHLTVQAAINAANLSNGSDTVRIARSASYSAQQLTINSSEELTLAGGYPTCTSATPSGPETVLSGAGGDARPVLSIVSHGAVFIRGLRLSDGDNEGGSSTGAGGGIYFTGSGLLDIANSAIVSNAANIGGGIYALGTTPTSEVLIGDNVTIGFNRARGNGGGIVAAGLEVTVTGRNTTVLQNEAQGLGGTDGFGGGILVISTPQFASFLYLSAGGIGGLGAVHGNRARFGGGISVFGATEAERDAEARIYTVYADAPVKLSANEATTSGGALHVRSDADFSGDTFGTVRLQYAFITDNLASDGAAFFLQGDGSLGVDAGSVIWFNALERPTSPAALPCPRGAPCGVIRGNVASATGAVIRSVISGSFIGRRLQIEDNSGGWLINMAGGRAQLFSTLLAANTVSQELIRQQTDSDSEFEEIALYNATIADNTIGAAHVLRAQNELILDSTLIVQPGKITAAPGGRTVNARFVISQEIASLPGGSAALEPPRFVDSARRDYRLRSGSRGVDYAFFGTDQANVRAQDLFGNNREIDVPQIGLTGARFVDVGAHERPELLPLVLNPDFNADLNLWQGLLAPSAWDGTQNIVGTPGSGSARVVYDPAPKDIRQAGRGQCIHIPAPGKYELNGYARIVPNSNPPLVSNTARLTWALRRNGGRFGCEDGLPDANGALTLATSSPWRRPNPSAVIEVGPGVWTRDTSITIVLDVLGGIQNPPTAWFDGITLEPQGDLIFLDGF
jgi:hypothetical protein